ncbi:MAG: reverse transcriptase domain-containing protein [Stenotrophomonas sp.]|uniref:reverse transcriptase domain-containing protein n=1 Tax=Stenotrophomonas sp. TaxID=69392 RepID=UPI003314B41E
MDVEVLAQAIRDESRKLILRYEAYQNNLHRDWLRNCKRTGLALQKEVRRPEYWGRDRKFDPFYCHARSLPIARSIVKKISAGWYIPNDPFEKEIPKQSGGTRRLRIYQVPDAAVSRLLYGRLLAKNKHRFSSFAYAYRDDRNVHYAVQDISLELSGRSRRFVAEYDFSDFFGNINHSFLLHQLKGHGLLLSEEDDVLVNSFLGREGRGIPQGTSISLFLANIACIELDKKFENLGVKFARYADDTVICSSSYDAVCRAVDALMEFSFRSGVPVNYKKSAGINLLSPSWHPNEIRSKESFDFLGYNIGLGSLSVKESSVLKIKQQISYIIYSNLIQPIKSSPLRSVAIPAGRRDPGLLSAMMQVRRYICGGLYKSELRRHAEGRGGQLRFKGVMSFYPLVTDFEQMKDLDGWLVAVIFRALKLRARMLAGHGYSRFHRFPFTVAQDKLVREFDAYRVHGKALLEIPSFELVLRSMQRAMREYGIAFVMNSRSNSYSY